MQWLRRSLATGCLALLTVASASPLNSQVALASFPDFTRSLLDRSAHLTVRGVTLEEGLNELQARSGVGIAFSPALLAREARVDCLCAASTVGEALSWMLQGRSFTFAEFGGQVTIEPVSALEGFRREATGRPARQLAQTPAFGTVRPAPRLGAVEPLPLRQEPVTGTVVSARTGQPLAGAQVMIEGTTRGVVTNSTGRFLLTNVEAATVTLRVVIIGYREHTETVATGSNIRIELEEIAIDLDAIVVTGTAGGSRTRALGTTLARVDMTEAMRVGQSGTFQELLNSNVAGLNMANGPGNVGTGAAIKIRGIGSVSLGSGPLVYVDGVRIDNNSNARIGSDQGNGTMRGGSVSRLNDINPEEIQSVEVIKGPAAATLYGTEASAGVIQITTKRGSVGAPQWEVTVRQGVSYLSNAVDRWPAVYDKGTSLCTNCEILPSGVRKFEVLKSEQALGHGIPFTYGHDQTFGISSRGGTDLIRYYVSAQMDRDEGFVDWNNQNKYSARANLELTPNEKLSIATNMGFVRSNARFNGGGPFPIEFVSSIYWGTPAAAEDERRRGWNWTPPWAMETVDVTENIDRIIASGTIRHNPFPWLVQRVTGGADFGSAISGRMVPRSPLGSADFFGSMSLGHVETTDRSVTQANVDYGATATVDLPFFGTTSETSFGAQYYVKNTHEFGAVGDQFPAPGPGTVSSAAVKTGWEDFIENKTLGVYVQEQLGWNNRLFLTAALRGDDNSAFGENFDFVLYPKVSGSWVLSEEPFFNTSFIDNLKLRAAWGRAGRQPDVFAARRLYAPITAGSDQPGLTTDAVGNPDLKPEVGEEFELGLDASLLSDRVALGFTFYNKNTKDAIIARPVSPSSGFAGTPVRQRRTAEQQGHRVRGERDPDPQPEPGLGLRLQLRDEQQRGGRSGRPAHHLPLRTAASGRASRGRHLRRERRVGGVRRQRQHRQRPVRSHARTGRRHRAVFPGTARVPRTLRAHLVRRIQHVGPLPPELPALRPRRLLRRLHQDQRRPGRFPPSLPELEGDPGARGPETRGDERDRGELDPGGRDQGRVGQAPRGLAVLQPVGADRVSGRQFGRIADHRCPQPGQSVDGPAHELRPQGDRRRTHAAVERLPRGGSLPPDIDAARDHGGRHSAPQLLTTDSMKGDTGTMYTQDKNGAHRRNRSRLSAVGITLLLATSNTACEDLLQVDLPTKVAAENLDNPSVAEVLVNSAIGEFECAFSQFVAASGQLTDELRHSSGWLVMTEWDHRKIGQDRDVALCNGNFGYGVFTPMQKARVSAESSRMRIEGWDDADVPGRPEKIAVVATYGAISRAILGEAFCEMTIDVGPIMPKTEMLQNAESALGEAMSLAQAAGRADLAEAARIRRAGVRLTLGDNSGAMSDAAAVSEGFRFDANYSSADRYRYNRIYHHNHVDGFISPEFNDENGQPTVDGDNPTFGGVVDPRVESTLSGIGQDGSPLRLIAIPGMDEPHRDRELRRGAVDHRRGGAGPDRGGHHQQASCGGGVAAL